ncbi:MAG: GNAT family N-acetyltransferase [Treponema sp.]|nr:GNAT family N-acetyltransferase [Treponema sp.]
MDNKILIKTKKLIIRNFKENDYKDLFEYLSDKETYKYEPGEPITIETAKSLCKKRSKNNDFLAVQLKNKIIGHIYLGQIEPKSIKTWETGFIFNKKYQGKGYATEALKAVIEYGFKKTDIHKIIAHCNPKNISSWKLLERIKMKREGKLRENIYFNVDNKGNPLWNDTYEYGILKKDL